MYEWEQNIQRLVERIDTCILTHDDEAMTLRAIAESLGYSAYHTTRRFRAVSGMQLRDYLRRRRLAFALKEVRDSQRPLLDIALDYGFSSHEAFTRAFRELYGVSPSVYRQDPRPVVLRTRLHPFDRYAFGLGELGMIRSENDIKTYFVTIPAHSFLCIEDRESNGYYDFWQRQAGRPGRDRETVCGLLDSIRGKLDDTGGSDIDCLAGQIMGYRNDTAGRLCAWGYPRTECYGVRLPADYSGPVPEPLQLDLIPTGDYLVFEHGPFNYEQAARSVEEQMEAAMRTFGYAASGCHLDTQTPGRMTYLYFSPGQYFKYVRPIAWDTDAK